MNDLTGRVAVVVGGHSGIGFEVIKQLVEHGVRIFAVVRRDLDEMQQTLDQLPGSGHRALLADVTDAAQLSAVFANVDKCDILINSIGYTPRLPYKELDKITDELFDKILTINLRSVFSSIRELSPLLKASGNGLVVNIGSSYATKPNPRHLPYSIAKAGLETLTKTLAVTLAPEVRVVSVCPSLINNNFAKGADPAIIESFRVRTPMQRLCTNKDVADVVLALATSMTFITGSTILVDGGFTLAY